MLVVTACSSEDATTCGTAVVDAALRSRDRRRLMRHGPDAITSIDASCFETSCLPMPQSLGVAEKLRPQHRVSERVSARDRKSSDCQVRVCGREGLDGHARVQYSSRGLAYVVDLRNMSQHDATTGQALKVSRLRPGSWSVKKGSQKSNGWTPYPNELSNELERVYAEIICREPETTSVDSESQTISELSLSALLAHVGNLASGEMSRDEVEQAKQVALKASAGPNMFIDAATLITQLAQKQGLCCTSDDARTVGLSIGSMSILQAVLMSDPEMKLCGLEIFHQKYASIKLNVQGRKDCIRCLLARGMTLGFHAHSSKLLKKVEADSLPLWKARFLSALVAKFPQLPEQNITRIWSFLI